MARAQAIHRELSRLRTGFEGTTTNGARKLLGVALLLFAASCGKAEIYHGLDEKEANEFVVTLAEKNIAADKMLVPSERGAPTFTIAVPPEKVVEAFDVLQRRGLPREKGLGIAAVYPGGGLIPGAFEEKAKFMLAMTGELENTLRSIDRVVDAHVHVVMPEDSVLKDEDEGTVRPTASVLIKFIPLEGKKPIEDMDVRQLVARAIEGLDVNDVTVVPIAVTEQGGGGGGTAGGGFKEMTLEQCVERYKDNLAAKDVVKMRPLGPTGIVVRDDSFTKLSLLLGGLALTAVVFLVAWVVTFISRSSLKSKLNNLQKAAKAKKGP